MRIACYDNANVVLILCVLSRTVPWKAGVARVPDRPPCRRQVLGGM